MFYCLRSYFINNQIYNMIQIVPSELILVYNPLAPIKAFVSIRNSYNSLISFKIKSTATQHFDVLPNRGDLRPNESKSIQFRINSVLSKDALRQLLARAKFLIQCLPISRPGQGDSDEAWRDKSLIENHKLKMRLDGLDDLFKPATPQNLNYASMKRDAPYVSPYASNQSIPSMQVRHVKAKKLNKFIAVLLLFLIGVIVGCGLRWYYNYTRRLADFKRIEPVPIPSIHDVPLHPVQVKQTVVVYQPDSNEYNIKFKAEDVPTVEKEFRLHINQEGHASIVEL